MPRAMVNRKGRSLAFGGMGGGGVHWAGQTLEVARYFMDM